MPADPKMVARPATIFISDVAFADIARHNQDFLGRMEQPRLAPGHHSLTRREAGRALVAPAASASARALALLSFADLEGATLEVGAVERLHGAGCVGIRHLDEAETTRTTRVAIVDQRNLFDGAMLGKQGIHGLIGR